MVPGELHAECVALLQARRGMGRPGGGCCAAPPAPPALGVHCSGLGHGMLLRPSGQRTRTAPEHCARLLALTQRCACCPGGAGTQACRCTETRHCQADLVSAAPPFGSAPLLGPMPGCQHACNSYMLAPYLRAVHMASCIAQSCSFHPLAYWRCQGLHSCPAHNPLRTSLPLHFSLAILS